MWRSGVMLVKDDPGDRNIPAYNQYLWQQHVFALFLKWRFVRAEMLVYYLLIPCSLFWGKTPLYRQMVSLNIVLAVQLILVHLWSLNNEALLPSGVVYIILLEAGK